MRMEHASRLCAQNAPDAQQPDQYDKRAQASVAALPPTAAGGRRAAGELHASDDQHELSSATSTPAHAQTRRAPGEGHRPRRSRGHLPGLAGDGDGESAPVREHSARRSDSGRRGSSQSASDESDAEPRRHLPRAHDEQPHASPEELATAPPGTVSDAPNAWRSLESQFIDPRTGAPILPPHLQPTSLLPQTRPDAAPGAPSLPAYSLSSAAAESRRERRWKSLENLLLEPDPSGAPAASAVHGVIPAADAPSRSSLKSLTPVPSELLAVRRTPGDGDGGAERPATTPAPSPSPSALQPLPLPAYRLAGVAAEARRDGCWKSLENLLLEDSEEARGQVKVVGVLPCEDAPGGESARAGASRVPASQRSTRFALGPDGRPLVMERVLSPNERYEGESNSNSSEDEQTHARHAKRLPRSAYRGANARPTRVASVGYRTDELPERYRDRNVAAHPPPPTQPPARPEGLDDAPRVLTARVVPVSPAATQSGTASAPPGSFNRERDQYNRLAQEAAPAFGTSPLKEPQQQAPANSTSHLPAYRLSRAAGESRAEGAWKSLENLLLEEADGTGAGTPYRVLGVLPCEDAPRADPSVPPTSLPPELRPAGATRATRRPVRHRPDSEADTETNSNQNYGGGSIYGIPARPRTGAQSPQSALLMRSAPPRRRGSASSLTDDSPNERHNSGVRLSLLPADGERAAAAAHQRPAPHRSASDSDEKMQTRLLEKQNQYSPGYSSSDQAYFTGDDTYAPGGTGRAAAAANAPSGAARHHRGRRERRPRAGRPVSIIHEEQDAAAEWLQAHARVARFAPQPGDPDYPETERAEPLPVLATTEGVPLAELQTAAAAAPLGAHARRPLVNSEARDEYSPHDRQSSNPNPNLPSTMRASALGRDSPTASALLVRSAAGRPQSPAPSALLGSRPSGAGNGPRGPSPAPSPSPSALSLSPNPLVSDYAPSARRPGHKTGPRRAVAGAGDDADVLVQELDDPHALIAAQERTSRPLTELERQALASLPTPPETEREEMLAHKRLHTFDVRDELQKPLGERLFVRSPTDPRLRRPLASGAKSPADGEQLNPRARTPPAARVRTARTPEPDSLLSPVDDDSKRQRAASRSSSSSSGSSGSDRAQTVVQGPRPVRRSPSLHDQFAVEPVANSSAARQPLQRPLGPDEDQNKYESDPQQVDRQAAASNTSNGKRFRSPVSGLAAEKRLASDEDTDGAEDEERLEDEEHYPETERVERELRVPSAEHLVPLSDLQPAAARASRTTRTPTPTSVHYAASSQLPVALAAELRSQSPGLVVFGEQARAASLRIPTPQPPAPIPVAERAPMVSSTNI